MFMSPPSHHDHHQQTAIAGTVVPGSNNQSIYSKVDKTKQKRKLKDQHSNRNSDLKNIQMMKNRRRWMSYKYGGDKRNKNRQYLLRQQRTRTSSL